MKTLVLVFLVLQLMVSAAISGSQVEIQTNMGTIRLELNDEKAPITVKNFLDYVDRGYYNGTIFHRVIDDFMIQGGGFDSHLERKKTAAAIKNEATNGLKNDKGTIAMARTGVVDSATSQFFINLSDNTFLNNRGTAAATYGYAVFGRVTEGMDVVEKIAKLKVGKKGSFQNFPTKTVVIYSANRVN
jgi:cyclophilin family peptidyl-prolyl cis-trans isomerase